MTLWEPHLPLVPTCTVLEDNPTPPRLDCRSTSLRLAATAKFRRKTRTIGVHCVDTCLPLRPCASASTAPIPFFAAMPHSIFNRIMHIPGIQNSPRWEVSCCGVLCYSKRLKLSWYPTMAHALPPDTLGYTRGCRIAGSRACGDASASRGPRALSECVVCCMSLVHAIGTHCTCLLSPLGCCAGSSLENVQQDRTRLLLQPMVGGAG